LTPGTDTIRQMSELRPSSPVRRPDTARPRSADAHEDAEVAAQPQEVGPPPSVAPVTLDELARIQRHMASLPLHSGAAVDQDDALGVLMVRRPGAGAALNYAAMPRWDASTWRSSLDRVTETMRREGSWPSVLLADRLDRPPGMDETMGSFGWRRLLGETVMWVGHASVVPHLDPRLRFEAVQPRSVDGHETLEREIFGVDPNRADARRQELRDALVTGGLRAFVVRLDDEPIAVARLSQGDGVAGIYALGVAHAWRGKGYGTLLATIATRAGMATGNRVVWLSVEDGNTPARHVYERLEFQPAFGWSRWLAPAD
jgi:ribosomal protein S18 acetylase RimI-like enzyme